MENPVVRCVNSLDKKIYKQLVINWDILPSRLPVGITVKAIFHRETLTYHTLFYLQYKYKSSLLFTIYQLYLFHLHLTWKITQI